MTIDNPPKHPSSSYGTIIVTGDSIAQVSFQVGGYGAALVDKYQGKMDVLNRGMGGYNSRQLLQRLNEDFGVAAGANVQLVTIGVGTNDSVIDFCMTTTVEEYSANLRAIIHRVRTLWPDAGIVLITPSTLDHVVDEANAVAFGFPDDLRARRRPDNTLKYVEACVEVGKVAGLPVIDVFKLHTAAIDGGVDISELYTDGIHYSAKGYSYVNDALHAVIAATAPHLEPAKLPWGFPDFVRYGREDDPVAKRLQDKIKELLLEMEKRDAGMQSS